MTGALRRVAMLAVAVAVAVGAVGCGGGEPEALRSYTVRLHVDDSSDEYDYLADDPVDDLRVGDEVTFEVTNTGALPHDLQVVAPDGGVVGVAPPVVAGDTLMLTIRFDEPGFYRLNCLVDDHLTVHGMQAIIEVTAP